MSIDKNEPFLAKFGRVGGGKPGVAGWCLKPAVGVHGRPGRVTRDWILRSAQDDVCNGGFRGWNPLGVRVESNEVRARGILPPQK